MLRSCEPLSLIESTDERAHKTLLTTISKHHRFAAAPMIPRIAVINNTIPSNMITMPIIVALMLIRPLSFFSSIKKYIPKDITPRPVNYIKDRISLYITERTCK